MLVRLNVRKSVCVKHVVVLSSPSVNSFCFGNKNNVKNPVLHRVFLCPQFIKYRTKLPAETHFPTKSAIASPQTGQNLVNYHTLLCLFAELLPLPHYVAGFTLPTLALKFKVQLEAKLRSETADW